MVILPPIISYHIYRYSTVITSYATTRLAHLQIVMLVTTHSILLICSISSQRDNNKKVPYGGYHNGSPTNCDYQRFTSTINFYQLVKEIYS